MRPNELAGLPEALRADLSRYLDLLKERFGPDLVSVVVFGSWARGEARPNSDLDLLIVARGLPGSRLERRGVFFRLARAVSEEFADVVTPVLLAPEEALRVKPFYLGMLAGHELLYDAGRFFGDVPDRISRLLAELDPPFALDVLCYTPEEFARKRHEHGTVSLALKEGIRL